MQLRCDPVHHIYRQNFFVANENVRQRGLNLSVITNKSNVRQTCPLFLPACGMDVNSSPSGFTSLGRKAHKSHLRSVVRAYSGFIQIDTQQLFALRDQILVAVQPLPPRDDLFKAGDACETQKCFSFFEKKSKTRTKMGAAWRPPKLGPAI